VHVADYFYPDFKLFKCTVPTEKHFLSLKIHQNASPGMQILKISWGRPPDPPPSPVAGGSPPHHNKAPATRRDPPGTFFQIENPGYMCIL